MRDCFDLDSSIIYLNSGTHSISPRSVRNAVRSFQDDYERNPTAGYVNAWGKLWAVQQKLAKFFAADPHDLFLRPNITAVLNDVILGIKLEKKEILVTDLEYGAIVNICRLRANRDDLKLRTFVMPFEPQMTSRMRDSDWVKLFASAILPETGMLLVSHVNSVNGLVLPVERIGKMTREKGVLLVVDGAHGPGAVSLDFQALRSVDFYGGNLHKWMMGPKGTAFGYVAKQKRSLLRPTQAGWATFGAHEPFDSFGDGDPFQHRMALRGCHDFSPYFALQDTVEFWEQRGREAIWKRLRALQDCLLQKMRLLAGFSLISPDQDPRGPLFAYRMPGKCSRLGFASARDLLLHYGLQVSISKAADEFFLRLSPHIYNTETEIVAAVQKISSWAAGL